MSNSVRFLFIAASLGCAGDRAVAAAAAPVDRVDPSLAREQVHAEPPPRAKTVADPVAHPSAAATPDLARPITVGAIKVEGSTMIPAAAFAPAIQPYLGRALGTAELRQLAT